MRYLKADTGVTVRIGPAISISDGYTLLSTLAISTADYAYSSDAGGTETDISAYTWAAVTSVTGWYDLTLTAGILGTEGPLTIMIGDVSLCLPIYCHFHVVNANVYDSLFAAATTDYLQIDVNQWNSVALSTTNPLPNVAAGANGGLPLGDANARVDVGSWLGTAVTTSSTSTKPEVDVYSVSDSTTGADSLQSQYDGTGLTGDTYPSTQAQLSNLVSVGAAVNATAESRTLTTYGTETNAYTDTVALDGTRWTLTDSAGALDVYAQFDITVEGVPTQATVVGYVTGGGDNIGVYAYNWAGTSWDQIGTITGGGANDATNTFALFTSHVGTGANIGKARIRFYTASGLTTATLAINQMYVSYAVVPYSRETIGTVSDVSPAAGGFNTDLTDVTNFWDDALLIFTSGSLAGQSKPITTYTVTNGAMTFDEAFTSAPANGDAFIIYQTHIHPVTQIRDAILADSTAFNGADIASILTDTGTTIPATLGTPSGADMSTDIASIKTDTGTTIPALIGTPTVDLSTDLANRTPTAAQLAYITANAATGIPVTFSGTGTTTTATLANVDGSAASSVTDQYKGRLLVFNAGTLLHVVTDITAYNGTTKVATVTAVPVAITSSHTARLI